VAKREYRTKNGKRVSGATTIISQNLGWGKEGLIWWSWNEGKEGRDYRETRDAAADIGTTAHRLIEMEILETGSATAELEMRALRNEESIINCLYAFRIWRDAYDFQPTHTETPLVSELYGYGGTPDGALIRNKRALYDLKTSNNLYPSHRIQVGGAYIQLWNENFPDDPVTGGYHVLRVGKDDASFHHHYWPTWDKEWEAFEHLLALHKLQRGLK